MKVFVTGATGFIGQHLCHYLAKQGHHVNAFVRNAHKISCLPKENITIVKGNLRNQTVFRSPCGPCTLHVLREP